MEHILSKLANVQKTGRRYTSDCPIHPSARLTIKREDGQILIECSSGCPDFEIVRALGLSSADLIDFDDEYAYGDTSEEPEDDDEDDQEEPENLPLPTNYYAHSPIRRNAFEAKYLAEWVDEAKAIPEPRRLFSDFWLEGELSILFSDTGKGKSILAMQIADSLARGVPIAPFELEVPAQKVLYFDFEMSGKQLERRYSTTRGDATISRYRFPRNIVRAELHADPDFPAYFETFEQYIHDSFEELLRDSGAGVVIVDNITYLNNSANLSPRRAFRLINELQRLKREYNVSMLILAHTPKRRPTHALTINDLHGSKMLSNFADNVFAIGASSTGGDVRYLKHIKPRNSEIRYDASNVCVFRIGKKKDFLGFNFIRYSTEREHLLSIAPDPNDRRLIAKHVRDMTTEGYTQRQIATHLGISIATVNRHLNPK